MTASFSLLNSIYYGPYLFIIRFAVGGIPVRRATLLCSWVAPKLLRWCQPWARIRPLQ